MRGELCSPFVGARFGSTHVRTSDRDAVITAATRGCRKLRWRCFVSEVRNGWIALFPGGHGQDLRLTEYLASKLACDIVHMQVTEEPAFRCWLWREHERVDGSAFAWAPLLRGDDFARLEAVLRGGDEEVARAARFAELLGLSDVELDYEEIADQLRDGDDEHAELVQLPAPRAHGRRPTDAVAVLRGEGPVVAVVDGFVRRTWQTHRGLSLVHPSGEPVERLLDIDGPRGGLVGARNGSRVAFEHGSEVVVFDVARRTTVARFATDTKYPGYAIDADGDRVAVANDRTLVIHDMRDDVARGRIALGTRRVLWHPAGRWIVAVSSGLVLVDVEHGTTHALCFPTETIDARGPFLDALRGSKWTRSGSDDLEQRRNLARISAQLAAIPNERVYDAHCSGDGATLWLATSLGVHAYDWAQLIATVECGADTLPRARWFTALQLARLGPELDDARLIVGDGDTVVTLERHSGRARFAVDVGAHVGVLALSRDGHWVAVQTEAGHAYGSELARALQIWRANTWRRSVLAE